MTCYLKKRQAIDSINCFLEMEAGKCELAEDPVYENLIQNVRLLLLLLLLL